ncbi:DUF1622 domain-containing protein [Geomonas sp. RF6]|uniref:DUF1622 domain-containing protein n=1 Tax=Geomonas sp. RF6 TaxID=2897342 RepID=UPI001E56FD2D|nr:DUF1622 domain-containing protein [Geomonas sp. RF6]UFS72224.1 DUF1622 domain-containing protein [Geomonas sp. RF6]
MDIAALIKVAAVSLEATGILVIAIGAILSTAHGVAGYLRRNATVDLYAAYRRQLSRAILLGLEFLVAADIIRTVAIEPTFTSVGILGAIVAIRTFLSFTLEVEVSGRWPWSRPGQEQPKEEARQGVPPDPRGAPLEGPREGRPCRPE